MTDDRSNVFNSVRAEVRHPVYFVPGVFFCSYWFLQLFPADELSPIFTQFIESLPAIVVGYLFGALGGVARVFDIVEQKDLSRIPRYNRVFGAAIVGLISAILIDSGMLPQVLFNTPAGELSVEPTFQGIALISFVFGLFSSETISRGRDWFQQSGTSVDNDNENKV